MVSVYSDPDAELLQASYGAAWSCMYNGLSALKMVDVKCVQSVVAVIPFPHVCPPTNAAVSDMCAGPYYIVEKMGLEVRQLGGIDDILSEE
jgi:hypothetical protein